MSGTETQNIVKLLVNGLEYSGWKKVSVTAGIERQARDFTLEVTDRWPEQTDIPRRIRPGDPCQLFIGADGIMTGYVDATPISYDGSSVTVGVKGRSKTADLVDCSAVNKPGQWKGQKLEKIAQDMATPYGIKVIAQADTGAVFVDHQIQQCETVFESIDRMLKFRHLLATDDADGNLVFITAGEEGTASPLILGQDGNILSGNADLDFKDRFSQYICKGQHAGTDADFEEEDDDASTEAATSESADTADAAITRKRVIIFKQSGQSDEGTCRDKVNYERDSRATKSLMASYKVQGWRQINGALWEPNKMVRVLDPIIGFDRQMLISEVQYELSEEGTFTTLTVGPREGFISSPAKKTKGKKSKKGNGDGWAHLDLAPVTDGTV